MISVGVDVSKGKSTACAIKPYGEIVASPFEFQHTESDLKSLCAMFSRMDDEVRVVMEATSIYHLPVATYAEACLARLLHESYRLEMNGRDMRNLKPINKN